MTFTILAPNAAQSPGLFPAQNNTNFTRLQAIINQEHNFLNTAPTPVESQGIHKQCTFINRASPGSLPAGNGILYSKPDAYGATQLRWYNGSSDNQITGLPIVIGIGSIALITAIPSVIFTVPASSFGYFYMWVTNPGTILNPGTFLMMQGTWNSNTNTVYITIPSQLPISLGFNNVFGGIINATLDVIATPGLGASGTYNFRFYQVI